MPEIVFIVGLPASGKTTLANSMGVPVFEDAKELPLNLEGDFVLESPEFCLIERLCQARSQALSEYPLHSQRVIFFRNSPRQCLINAHTRDKHRVVDGMIRYMSQRYSPPKDAIPVYGSEGG